MTTHQPDRPSSDPLPVIGPEGEFDIDALPPLEGQTNAAVTGYGGLVLDASRITFADSMFLRPTLTTHDRGDLRIAAPSPTVQRLFAVVGADQVLRIHSTVDAALTG